MKKALALVLAAILCLFAFAGCQKEETPESVRIFALKGPTGMGMSKMISDSTADGEESNYTFTIAASPEELSAEIINGTYDIAAVPTNLAAVLYNKTEGALMIGAVNTLGVLYVLENGNTVQSISDLNGKTIYATGQASTPEYVLDYILDANGIECEVIYLTEHAELATQMAAGGVVLGMLPVPNVTSVMAQNPDVRIALNLTEEWEKAAQKNGDDGALYQGCVVIRREFAKTYPNAVKKFLEEYKASVEFVNGNPTEASQIIADCGIIPAAGVALKALPDANIVFIPGDEMAEGLRGFFEVLFASNPKSVGGKVPDDAIFYKN